MWLVPEDLIKIGLAILVGGIIGLEREYRDKAAGFRTIIFICLGATLITMISIRLGGPDDPVRIAANIIVGIGFLGAGVILRGRKRIVGLTTAATIWIAAALGMAIGGGEYILTGVVLVAVVIVLWLFPFIERWIERTRDLRFYEVVCEYDGEIQTEIDQIFSQSGLRVKLESRYRVGSKITLRYEVFGRPEKHSILEDRLIDNPNVINFRD